MSHKDPYACPVCNGALSAWTEKVIEFRAIVDPKTGQFQPVLQTDMGNATGYRGLICSNPGCGWTAHSADYDIPTIFGNELPASGFAELFRLAGKSTKNIVAKAAISSTEAIWVERQHSSGILLPFVLDYTIGITLPEGVSKRYRTLTGAKRAAAKYLGKLNWQSLDSNQIIQERLAGENHE